MDVSNIRKILGWCIIINLVMMLLFISISYLDHDWMYEIHFNFFQVAREDYESLLFNYMAFWKLLILVFFVIPYIAIRIVSKS